MASVFQGVLSISEQRFASSEQEESAQKSSRSEAVTRGGGSVLAELCERALGWSASGHYRLRTEVP